MRSDTAARVRIFDKLAAAGVPRATADGAWRPVQRRLRVDAFEHVAAIVAAVSPKSVNLLINAPFITVAEAAASRVGWL